MNSQEQPNPAPSFELPKAPGPEKGQAAMVSESQAASVIEQQPVSQVSLPQAPPPPNLQGQSSGQPQDDASAQAAVGVSTPQIADDNDLIEKEWVQKAKEIVARTAHDPHMQNRAISQIKADYLKKRYNKDIKLSEDG